MNVPPFLGAVESGADPLVAEALGRLGTLAEAAGHGGWSAPALPIDGPRFDNLADHAGLGHGECLVLALLLAVEGDASVARLVAAIQTPVGGPRPLAGFLATLFAPEGITPLSLWSGPAARAGIFVWGDEPAPLPERSLSLPAWIAAALSGLEALPPGVTELTQPQVRLHNSALALAVELGESLRGSVRSSALHVLRTSCPAEGEALALAALAELGRSPCELVEPGASALGAWLAIDGRCGVLHRRAGPGETIDLGAWDRLDAPLLLITGTDGQVASFRPRREWPVPMPSEGERAQLWHEWGLDQTAADQAAARLRQGAGRIAEIGRALPETGAGLTELGAVMAAGGGRIDGLARRAQAIVKLGDIVLPPALEEGLARLRDRILLRNRLGEGLGPTIAARYRPGVRALFTGESGTGKTLAAHWLAGEAGLPCYRVDLAAMTSKWIGETEKNLSQLLDAAEQGDVLLFFDEADALFGARTDVGDANDRHANAQTNYLLQRIEEFDGVAVMATNSRDRFDPAFVRRLDTVLEFPLPDASARRLLWNRHLGHEHVISAERLDQLSAAVDLAGGHVRNVVLAAASRARSQSRAIGEDDLIAAIGEEYAKLGRSLPPAASG